MNDRQMERRQNTCEILLDRHNRKSFLHRIVTGDEKWIFFENPKRKKSWVGPGEPSTSSARPNRFGKKTMLCVWWDQKGVVYYELLKPGETINTQRYQQQIIELARELCKKRPEYARVSFSSMTTHHHTQQDWSGIRWMHLAGSCYPTRPTLQIWPLPTTICLRRWDTRLLSSTSILMKMLKNGSMGGSYPKGMNSFGVESTIFPKDGKNV